MASYHLSCLALSTMFMALTFSILRPELSFALWYAVLREFEKLRARRHAMKSRQVEEKMKKYWVIDMRKLR